MNHTMIRIFCITLLLSIETPHFAVAAETEGDNGKTEGRQAIGTRTTQWLGLQREGQAPGNLLPIPAAEAGPSYQRYIDSFAIPMPDQLLSQSPAYGTKR
jgi:hypothetical protein